MRELKRVTKDECIVNILSLWYQMPVSEILKISQNIKRNGQYTPEKGETDTMKLDVVKTNYQKGERPEIRMKLKESGNGLESITIIYRNENDLPELERLATERREAWNKPLPKGGEKAMDKGTPDRITETITWKPDAKPEQGGKDSAKTVPGITVQDGKLYRTEIPVKDKKQ